MRVGLSRQRRGIFGVFGLAMFGVGLAGALLVGGIPLAVAAPPSPSASAARTPAPVSVNAEIAVLHATHSDPPGSIDPKIGNMPRLREPPFSSYNTYRLLDRQTLPLQKGKPGTLVLPTGRTLRVTFTDFTSDNRFGVQASISQPDGGEYLKLIDFTAAPNETFFVGGLIYQKGSLVLAITLRP